MSFNKHIKTNRTNSTPQSLRCTRVNSEASTFRSENYERGNGAKSTMKFESPHPVAAHLQHYTNRSHKYIYHDNPAEKINNSKVYATMFKPEYFKRLRSGLSHKELLNNSYNDVKKEFHKRGSVGAMKWDVKKVQHG